MVLAGSAGNSKFFTTGLTKSIQILEVEQTVADYFTDGLDYVDLPFNRGGNFTL